MDEVYVLKKFLRIILIVSGMSTYPKLIIAVVKNNIIKINLLITSSTY